MITQLIAIIGLGIPAAEPLRQIVFAFDQPEPKLEVVVFASDKPEDLEELAQKEGLSVSIENGVAFVCRKNILKIEDAKNSRGPHETVHHRALRAVQDEGSEPVPRRRAGAY
ncbi:MAG TPA: hypothetical protein PLL78_01955 [Fimbriimonadaceae bacterium]|nr:hypothetical protein [Fimbriimonadaceae bacterium]HRJ95422.1 hypothetical protein [Fimbriimonadaceae bacterium]